MSYLVFLGKEIREILKTKKIFIMPAVFLFFGFLSPLAARYINVIVKSVGGIDIALPEPTYIDAFSQFFKNLNQMGLFVVILALASTIVEEKVKGTAVLALTKCMPRNRFILSKLTAAALLYTFSYMLAAGACMYYVFLLFPDFRSGNLALALFTHWLYGLYIVALTILASILGRSFTMSAVIAFSGFAVTSLLSIASKVSKYLPTTLNELGLNLISGAKAPGDALVPVLSTVAFIMLFTFIGIFTFNRQEL